ncbi:MAG: ornithine racemase Orr [Eubacteriales bacterium]|jgi:predicted amino acid racemase|nr:ornithine racemase Orr [Eubacteriales bacterium]NLF47831.1 alanine/ornithine racemase family PLP-dependent enzyme [Clostridiales bacterium]
MYPRLLINIEKLKKNIDAVAKITKEDGNCSMMIVTKALCADRKTAEMIGKHPQVDYVADSRIANIKTYSEFVRKNGKETVLMRLPMGSEIKDVVRYADISFNSEVSTLEMLDKEAAKQGVVHKVVLMIDLGDLREGMFFENENEIFKAARTVLAAGNLELFGLGTNLTCYGAIIPKYDNLSVLCTWADRIEGKLNIKIPMISGGNSSSIYLIPKGEMPERINNLRLGESFLLGNDTAYCTKLKGTTDDALILEAQIIELKEKPSLPIGEVGVDAFGNRPEYEDRGTIKRAILAVGQQDTEQSGLHPLDEKVDVLGASSDHLILDVTGSDKKYKPGDVMQFKMEYGAVLKAATSPYVEKVYK